MSTTSLDYFTAGLAKSFERRAKKQPTKQHTQKVAGNVVTSYINTTTILSDEAYKSSLLCKMRLRLAQMKANDNSQ